MTRNACTDELAAAGEGRPGTPSSGEGEDDRAPRRPAALDPAMLGPPDCLLVGAGWSFPVHRCRTQVRSISGVCICTHSTQLCCAASAKNHGNGRVDLPASCCIRQPCSNGLALMCSACRRAVLCVRCELLRARCSSGMRDASAARVQVPEHFARPVIDAFVACVPKPRALQMAFLSPNNHAVDVCGLLFAGLSMCPPHCSTLKQCSPAIPCNLLFSRIVCGEHLLWGGCAGICTRTRSTWTWSRRRRRRSCRWACTTAPRG